MSRPASNGSGAARALPEIEFVLCDPKDHSKELSLFYNPTPLPVSRRYVEALRECELKGDEILDPDRFYNFPGCHKDRAWTVAQLAEKIEILNAHAPGSVELRASHEMSQEHMNLLHLRFEVLRGQLLNPAPFFLSAPPEVRRALGDYNLLIHRYESCLKNEENLRRWNEAAAHAVLTFVEETRNRYPLKEEDYRHFHRRSVFGDLHLNYCDLGKPVLDVIRDRDTTIGDEDIRPLRYLSGEAAMMFGKTQEWQHYASEELKLAAWWYGDEAKRLRALGFPPNDPRNALGHITIGTLARDTGAIAGLSEKEIVELVGRHQHFLRVHAHPRPPPRRLGWLPLFNPR